MISLIRFAGHSICRVNSDAARSVIKFVLKYLSRIDGTLVYG